MLLKVREKSLGKEVPRCAFAAAGHFLEVKEEEWGRRQLFLCKLGFVSFFYLIQIKDCLPLRKWLI